MKKIIQASIFLIILLMFSYSSFSSHYGGGEITWKNVGTDSFLIRLTTFSDCKGVPMATSAAIKFICNSTGVLLTTNTINYSAVYDITPICAASCTKCSNPSCSFAYGVREYIFETLVVFNSSLSCCQIKISFDGDPSISSSVTNIVNGNSIYNYSILNRCLAPQDNSPQFAEPPMTILCLGLDAYLNYGVYDNDKDSIGRKTDSLYYEWAEPSATSTSFLQYISTLSYDKPLHFFGFPNVNNPMPNGYHLNNATGDISFRPTNVEGTVMCLKIKEFRNGVYIGEINRVNILLSISCPGSNKAPVLAAASNIYYKTVCTGSNVTFNLSTFDPNNADTVFLNWDQTIPGAIWTSNSGSSRLPTASFSWTPNDSDATLFAHTFVATATDNACPILASASKAFQIRVNIDVPVVPQTTNLGCGIFYLDATPLKNYSLNYQWNIAGGTTSNSKSFIFKTAKPGIYPYTLQISGKGLCAKTYYGNIVTDSFLWGVDLPPDTQVCYGEKVNLNVKYYDPHGKARFTWNTSINDTLPFKSFILYKDTTIKVNIIDSVGCTGEDSIHIKLKNLPNITALGDTTVCYQNPVVLTAKGGNKYKWSTGDTSAVINFISSISTYYKVTGISSNGCNSEDSVKVDVLSLPVADAGNDTSMCLGDTIFLAATGGVKYNWNTGDTVSLLKISPTQSGYYTVTITGSNSCSKADSVLVTLNQLPIADAGKDTTVCSGSLLTLVASGGDEYHWNNGVNNANNTIKPIVPDYFHVVVTDSNHCSADDSVYVSIYPLPLANAGKDTLICAGQNILLNATGGVFYYWNTGQTSQSIQIAAVSNTYYSVQVKDSNQCYDYDSVLISIKPLPKVRFGGDPLIGLIPLNVAFHDSSTITTGSIISWLWDFDDSSTSIVSNPSHKFLRNGYFNIKLVVISNLDCKDSVIRFNYISTLPSDIEYTDNNSKVILIPNPAKNYSILQVKSNQMHIKSLSLLSSSGKLIRNYDFNISGQYKIEKNGLKNGVYYLQINLNDKHIIYKKLIFE